MNLLTVEDFTFCYPGQSREALSHISMEIKAGSFTVLCGSSGCGKSTLLRQWKSVLAPHGSRTGIIRYDGQVLEQVDGRRQSREIGYVLQDPDSQIVTDKVWHELAFGLESLGLDNALIRLRVAEMASYFGIRGWFHKKVEELSGGQKQLLNLASVMAMHPKLLILDEPTSQLDPIAASDFLGTIKKLNRDLGITVVLTEHRLEEVLTWAEKMIVMDSGKILAQGTPQEVGERLHELGHGMFPAMPAPMRIYQESPVKEGECPLTIGEGRIWLNGLMERRGISRAEETGQLEALRDTKGIFSRMFPGQEKKQAPVLRARDLWFRYEPDLPDVIRGLSLDIGEGEFFALVGGNGAGKSTAMSLFSGVRAPYRGKIWLKGKELCKYGNKELYYGFLGALPQNPQSLFLKKTVREDLYEMIGGKKEKKSDAYPIDMAKKDAVAGIVNLTRMGHLLDRHPYDLSGGEQQRLALAKVLLLRPRLLLLDEPTKGLDAAFKEELGEILRKLCGHGITVFMISHDVEFTARYADRVGLFFDGDVVTAQPAKQFFAGNHFYTTAANRMAREYFPEAVCAEEVVECLRATV